jgi:hypothetical protein
LTTLQNQLGNYYTIIAEKYKKGKEIFNVFLAFKHFYWLKSICSSGKVGPVLREDGCFRPGGEKELNSFRRSAIINPVLQGGPGF